jgi:GTP-binding protein
MEKKYSSIPVVAIVGRPNVGKSTLFNKIIGKRNAIVDNTVVGLTRDRNYNVTTFREKDFLLVDTGGFEPASENSIVKQVKEQAYLAVQEADAVIFLCDGKEGLTREDVEIYRYLRKTGKPVFVSINKIDDPKHRDRIYEFYQLGTESLFPVSAEHGTGIEDILEAVFDLLPDFKREDQEENGIKISVVGRPNVGKSSLVNKILNEKRILVDASPGTTRDPVDTFFKKGDKEFLLIDTAGIRKKGRVTDVIEKFSVIMAIRSIERSDIALILIDAEEGITAQDSKIAGYAYEAGKGIKGNQKKSQIPRFRSDSLRFCKNRGGDKHAFITNGKCLR